MELLHRSSADFPFHHLVPDVVVPIRMTATEICSPSDSRAHVESFFHAGQMLRLEDGRVNVSKNVTL